MENASPLPEGYSELLKIDLQKDRKSALLVNGLALLIALPMVAVGAVMAPFSTLLDSSAGWLAYAGRWGVLLAGLVAYMLLHELVHGICMKHYSGEKVRYGFTGLPEARRISTRDLILSLPWRPLWCGASCFSS